MKEKSFKHDLALLLKDDAQLPSMQQRKAEKQKLLSALSKVDSMRMEREMLSLLKRQYKPVSTGHASQLRSQILDSIVDRRNKASTPLSLQPTFLFLKRVTAFSFAILLFGVSALAPFQALVPLQIVQQAKAAFLECEGRVTVNGNLCDGSEVVAIQTGDHIKTLENALATLFFTDYSLLRFESETSVVIDEEQPELVHVEQGSLWVHSPAEIEDQALQIATPELKMKVPKGSAGISIHPLYTELLSTTAVVEVQIDTVEGQKELVTVPPEKGIWLTKNSQAPQLRDADRGRAEKTWIESNKEKDALYLEHVKERTVAENTAKAGVLPGTVPDYVDKVTHSARTAMTWDEETRISRDLAQLDELFAEALVLYEKGDETTAEETFEVYREKISSLMLDESDKIRVNNQNTNSPSALALLKEHTQKVSPFGIDDPQYVLKENVESLTLNLETTVQHPETNTLVKNVTEQKIRDAHHSLVDGRVQEAERLLKEVNDLEDQAEGSELAPSNASVQILTGIAERSEVLEPLAQEIKEKKVEKIKLQEPVVVKKEIVTGLAMGTAIRPTDDELEVDSTEDEGGDEYLSRAVGQAIKAPEESVLE